MNDLEAFFNQHEGRQINKWAHYFEIYDRHFSRYRGKEVHLLEIGVNHGGSLEMWKEYFGPGVRIYGADINPACLELAQEGVEIFLCDQGSRESLRELGEKVPKIDILIDDGGHLMDHQILTYEELYPLVAEDGVYLCEDCHTSYWPDFEGGRGRKGTYMEYIKDWVDEINAYHSKSVDFQPTELTRSAHSLHIYDSVVVIEKRPISPPKCRVVGEPTVPAYEPPPPPPRPLIERVLGRLRRSSSGK